MNREVKINKQYKDRLFRLLFGSMEMAENIVSLYNALNGTSHNKEDIDEITTIDDVIYIKMKNDVSFLIDNYLTLWEQQSSFNPNMPIRGFMYYGNLFSQYIEENKKNLYGKTLVKLPTPRYVVFYNGTTDRPEVEKLRLSDAFMHTDNSGEFEWTATVYNLNKGNNRKLFSECKPLSDYMTLVNYIRDYQNDGQNVRNSVDLAVQRCIKENVLKDFLTKHRAEVMDMCITEFDEKTYADGLRAEGRAEGVEEGIMKTLIGLVKDGLLSAAEAAKRASMSEPDFQKLINNNRK